ncbi:MAG TPA: hypothetical protein VFS38_00750 [Actinomycetota bacterium]|nr:hypothetical protein [Actinomycetota bacterium]
MKAPKAASLSISGLWVLTALWAGAGAILTMIAWSDLKPADAYLNLLSAPSAVAYATLGALILRRTGNRVGLVFLGEGLGGALISVTSTYAIVGLVTRPGALPAAKVVGTLSELMFIPAFMGILYALLIFPTGTIPSPRWRWVATAMWVAAALSLIGFVITPRQVALPAPGGISLNYPNPFALHSLKPMISTLMLGTIPSLSVASVMFFASTAVALAVRYRSGRERLRQQIKWVAFVAFAWVAFQALLALGQGSIGYDSPLTIIGGIASGFTAQVLIPIAIAVAILRYRLYDIDLIINRALVYGTLTALLALIYVAGVVGIGGLLREVSGRGTNNLAVAVSTLAVAAIFRPARTHIQGFIDRRFYRAKYDAARIMEAFSARLRDEVDLDAVKCDLVAVTKKTMQPTHVSLWLRHPADSA